MGTVVSLITTAGVEQSLLGTIHTLNADAQDFRTRVPEQVRWLARAAIAYETERSGCPQREVAMANHKHDWISERNFVRGCDPLRRELAPNGAERVSFEVELARHELTVSTQGRDAVVAISGAQMPLSSPPRATACGDIRVSVRMRAGLTDLPPPTFLFNILDGKKIQIGGTVANARAMILELLKTKYEVPVRVGMQEFLEDARQIRRTVDANFS
ncbi:hypothetical protein FB451DRAFT_1188983 [Mycena latifolia]|nr:hypothetical protein FB451DRAFT_1188983 [Mycena latifolia]